MLFFNIHKNIIFFTKINETYFKTEYPEHNLVRARNQFALVKDMEDKMEQMENIIKNI